MAYSLATGCPSLARVKQTQISSLLKKFVVTNVDTEVDSQRKKLFRKIIRSRIGQVGEDAAEGSDEEMKDDDQEEEEEDFEDYDAESDDEGSSHHS